MGNLTLTFRLWSLYLAILCWSFGRTKVVIKSRKVLREYRPDTNNTVTINNKKCLSTNFEKALWPWPLMSWQDSCARNVSMLWWSFVPSKFKIRLGLIMLKKRTISPQYINRILSKKQTSNRHCDPDLWAVIILRVRDTSSCWDDYYYIFIIWFLTAKRRYVMAEIWVKFFWNSTRHQKVANERTDGDTMNWR